MNLTRPGKIFEKFANDQLAADLEVMIEVLGKRKMWDHWKQMHIVSGTVSQEAQTIAAIWGFTQAEKK